SEAAALGLRGGLVVVPAAPALVDLVHDRAYCEALLAADLAITDSGLMVLLWNLMNLERIPRVSGLEYLKLILEDPSVRAQGATLWIMPNRQAAEKNVRWLRQQGHPTTLEDCYLAPKYDSQNVSDGALLELVESRKPKNLIICLGGGTQ